MRRRDFLKAAGLGVGAFALPGCAQAFLREAKGKKPNIVYIMIDELGYFELSCMGNKYLRTPNIDRMASEGMRFTQALAGGPVCAPTRCVLMTGQHTGHCTVRKNSQVWPMRAEDVTVAEVLKQAGYATGGFGKWGCGDRGTTGAPERHGFDIFFGYYNQTHAHSFFPNYLVRNGEKVPLEGNTGDFSEGKQFSQYLIFDESIRFIRKNKGRPFFCYCAWTPPHGRWGIPEDEPAWLEFKDKPWPGVPKDAKVYAAMVAMVDRQIGQILALLKELGIEDNTIVFVCGDNGGRGGFNNFFDPNRYFRGQKGNLYEGGLRVPMIIRWPGRIKPGVVSDFLWYFADVMPTLAELAGTSPPENIDGMSIVPTLLGEDVSGRRQQEHEFLYWEHQQQVAVRMGDYKAIKPARNKPFELYDLSKDIGEQNNIADRFPDVLAKMKGFAEQSHTENLIGDVLDKEQRFKGHQFR
ncbi:MAG: sulfatase-like hydrolase/transferase [Phycisphaerales bacterium]|nr:MAG: sulfatase-like hydrolase/transferase [Phycisphaerales bacterium]